MKYRTLDEIAKAFDRHRNTVGRWFSQEDAPRKGKDGTYNFDEVAEFVLKCETFGKQKLAGKSNPQILNLKIDELKEKIRKLKLANDLTEETLMPVAERDNEFREAFRDTQAELMQIPSRAIELTGLPAPQVEKRLRDMLHEALRHLKAKATEPAKKHDS